MKALRYFLQTAWMLLLWLSGTIAMSGQDVTTIKATDSDISDHLNLEAVASVFGDAKNLEDFERKLNDPELKLSNLDLNNDGYVDYLRVVEYTENYTHLIVIQAVLDKDVYQDVATIEVERDDDGRTVVQVVGDVYMYGEDYIIEPVYVHRPVFFVSFWRPYYRPYVSVYYWGFWPPYWHYWHPFRIDVYHHHIYHNCINYNYTFRYTRIHRSHVALHLHRRYRRNDYGRRYPKRSFVARRGVRRMDLDKVRRISESRRSAVRKNSSVKPATGKRGNLAKPNYKTGNTLRRDKTLSGKTNMELRSKPAYKTGKDIRQKPAGIKDKSAHARSGKNITKGRPLHQTTIRNHAEKPGKSVRKGAPEQSKSIKHGNSRGKRTEKPSGTVKRSKHTGRSKPSRKRTSAKASRSNSRSTYSGSRPSRGNSRSRQSAKSTRSRRI